MSEISCGLLYIPMSPHPRSSPISCTPPPPPTSRWMSSFPLHAPLTFSAVLCKNLPLLHPPHINSASCLVLLSFFGLLFTSNSCSLRTWACQLWQVMRLPSGLPSEYCLTFSFTLGQSAPLGILQLFQKCSPILYPPLPLPG